MGGGPCAERSGDPGTFRAVWGGSPLSSFSWTSGPADPALFTIFILTEPSLMCAGRPPRGSETRLFAHTFFWSIGGLTSSF